MANSVDRRVTPGILIRFVTSIAILLACSLQAAAQSHGHVPRIGILFIGDPSPDDPTANAFVDGLRALGYDPGRNIVLDFRYARGRPERLEALAAELVSSRSDVLVTGGPGPLDAARKASTTIPIVTVAGSDPVAEGWAKSLARPGGQVTGLTVTFPDLASKRLELLKEALPQLVRLGVLADPGEVKLPLVTDFMEPVARRMGVRLQLLDVRQPADFEPAFRLAREERVQAILNVDTTFVLANRTLVAEFAARERLPLAGEFTAFGADGMLMAYGANLSDLLRRAASHVDRILKGASPGELPIERPTKLELLINLKVARTLGITIPPSLLLRADRIIE